MDYIPESIDQEQSGFWWNHRGKRLEELRLNNFTVV